MIRTSKRQRVEKRHFGEDGEDEVDAGDSAPHTPGSFGAPSAGGGKGKKKEKTGGKGKSTDVEFDMGMDMDMESGVLHTPLSAKSQKRKKMSGKSHGGKGRKLHHSDDEGETPESPQQGLEFLIAAVSDVLVRATHALPRVLRRWSVPSASATPRHASARAGKQGCSSSACHRAAAIDPPTPARRQSCRPRTQPRTTAGLGTPAKTCPCQ